MDVPAGLLEEEEAEGVSDEDAAEEDAAEELGAAAVVSEEPHPARARREAALTAGRMYRIFMGPASWVGRDPSAPVRGGPNALYDGPPP
ncbi:hypothetical protein OG218_00100 [Kineococcus sp. NBC_00420]|uniref:hypothetical protein n=1 Tax=unclassified Kineococcus TaxID=2621656 RepID=UPI002E23F096